MKITNKNIEDSKQNRDKFNKYYNDAVIDVIAKPIQTILVTWPRSQPLFTHM